MRTLIVGYGNPLREDDGVGRWVVDQLDNGQLSNVEFWRLQQLQIEIAEDIGAFDQVILVDAATDGADIIFEEVLPNSIEGRGSSHHLDAAWLLRLTQTAYGRAPKIFLCRVRGESFGFNTALTTSTRQRGRQAVHMIIQFLVKERANA